MADPRYRLPAYRVPLALLCPQLPGARHEAAARAPWTGAAMVQRPWALAPLRRPRCLRVAPTLHRSARSSQAR
eukprot:8242574-Lingulodinium_polyedra.AAC.1